jgi:hypothetical protein
MQTCLFPHQEDRVLALSPDDRARFDEIAAFVEFELGEIRINAERAAYRIVFGSDDLTSYRYPNFALSEYSRH